MPALGDVLAGRYRIDARLGAGGMATAWRARDLRLERDVAVKVLLPNLAGDPALAARFDREARALAKLSDPHVVGIHDVVEGAAGTEPFLVMELCPDGSLGDRLADGAALPVALALPLLADAAAGLAALHAHGMVHRDVTPRNILLVGATAKLGDLGLARVEDAPTPPGARLTPTGSAVGTLGYLAPEILDGRPASPAADVYGLGAVAYRTLTGALPRPAGSIAELVAARERPVRSLVEAAPAVPSEAAIAIERALDPDPRRRPTAAVLAAALAGAAGGGEGPSLGASRDSSAGRRDAADERTALDVRRPAAPPAATAPAPATPAPSADQPHRGGREPRPLPDASPRYHGPGLWSGEAVAVIAIAIGLVLLVLVLGGRPG